MLAVRRAAGARGHGCRRSGRRPQARSRRRPRRRASPRTAPARAGPRRARRHSARHRRARCRRSESPRGCRRARAGSPPPPGDATPSARPRRAGCSRSGNRRGRRSRGSAAAGCPWRRSPGRCRGRRGSGARRAARRTAAAARSCRRRARAAEVERGCSARARGCRRGSAPSRLMRRAASVSRSANQGIRRWSWVAITSVAPEASAWRSSSSVDRGAVAVVERRGRLVGEDQRRPVDQRARDRDPLRLALAELVRPRPRQRREAELGRAGRRCARARAAGRRACARGGGCPRTLSAPIRCSRCSTMPMWRLRRRSTRGRAQAPASAWPATAIAPRVGRSRPAIRCRSVLLPLPEGPEHQRVAAGRDRPAGDPQHRARAEALLEMPHSQHRLRGGRQPSGARSALGLIARGRTMMLLRRRRRRLPRGRLRRHTARAATEWSMRFTSLATGLLAMLGGAALAAEGDDLVVTGRRRQPALPAPGGGAGAPPGLSRRAGGRARPRGRLGARAPAGARHRGLDPRLAARPRPAARRPPAARQPARRRAACRAAARARPPSRRARRGATAPAPPAGRPPRERRHADGGRSSRWPAAPAARPRSRAFATAVTYLNERALAAAGVELFADVRVDRRRASPRWSRPTPGTWCRKAAGRAISTRCSIAGRQPSAAAGRRASQIVDESGRCARRAVDALNEPGERP